MTVSIPFIKDIEFSYDEAERLSPLIRRVIAKNPTAFTYKGTGTFIIGRGEVAILDPGPDLQEHIDAVLAALAQDGETVKAILVTHTHKDHSPGARLLQAATGAPTYGYGPHGCDAREIQEHSPNEGGDMDFDPDVRLQDGDVVSGPGWTITALHTPGHTSNHLCFALEEEKALFTGDHVMAWSTSIVCPPDGDMAAYMANLKRLAAREDTIYYPTHGPAIPDPKPFLDRYIAYREAREDQIAERIARGLTTVKTIVDDLYSDVDPRVRVAAGLMVLAHLEHMTGDGRAEVVGGGRASLDAEYRLARQAA